MFYRNTDARSFPKALAAVSAAGWWTLTGVAAALVFLAVQQGLAIVPAAVTIAVLLALLVPWLVFGFREAHVRLPEPEAAAPFVVLALLVVYLLYWAGTGGGSVRGLITLTLYLGIGAALVLPVDDSASVWLFIAALFLWLPFDLHWEAFAFLPFDIPWEGQRIMAGVWTWPEDQLGYPLSALLAVDAALLLFGWARPVRLKFHWELSRERLLLWFGLLAGLTAVLVPLGWWTGFLTPGLGGVFDSPPLTGALESLVTALAIFLFTGVPEELLFRGVVQRWLHSVLGESGAGKWAALLLASVIFGAAHLNNIAGGFTPPNYVYMGMATIAGLAYGWAWMRGGIVTAALLHTSVDWIWGLFLQGGS